MENRLHFSPTERPGQVPLEETKREKSARVCDIEKPQILMSEEEFRAYLREHLDSDKGDY